MKVNSDTKVANLNADELDGASFVISGFNLFDPPSIPAQSCPWMTFTGGLFGNVQLNDIGEVYPVSSMNAGLTVQPLFQSSPGELEFKLCNITGSAINDGSRNYAFQVLRPQ